MIVSGRQQRDSATHLYIHTYTHTHTHTHICICFYMTRKTQREDGHVKTEAETRVTLPQAKECLGTKEAGRGKEGSLGGFKGSMSLPTC